MLICVAVIAILLQQAKNCTQFHASNYRVTKMRLLRGLRNIKAHTSLTAASRPEAYQALPSSLCTSVFYLPPLLLIPPSFPISPPLSYPLPSSSFLSFPFLSFSLSPLPFLLFPSPEVLQWNTEDVCQWFEELGLEEYHESIHTHEITGKELLDLHRSDLMVSECLSLASFPPPVFDHLQYANTERIDTWGCACPMSI